MAMDIFALLLEKLTSNPEVIAMVMGVLVKFAVDWLKKKFVTLDADGTKKYKIPVQALVAVCSMVATLGDLYLRSQLATFDPSQLINLITVTLPIYLSAMGIHLVDKNIKDKAKLNAK